jgi:pimeloyl-ACP methyl ester carboxylesterase
MKFTEKKTEVNNRKVSYWEKNSDRKETIVILHGFPGNHVALMDMVSNLGDYRIVIPDLPACGHTESLKAKHVLKNYSDWLYNFLEIISIDKPIIIGYSFGSRVALTFAVLYPTKIKKLALITPVVKVDSLIARLASLEYEIADKLPPHMQKTWLSNGIYRGLSNMIIFKSASKKRRQYLIKNDAKEIKRIDPRANIEIFNEFFAAKPISEGKKINIKTLIIAADKDEIATVKSVKELCGRFTDVEFEIIKDSGHIAVAERPKKTASIIKKWLQ